LFRQVFACPGGCAFKGGRVVLNFHHGGFFSPNSGGLSFWAAPKEGGISLHLANPIPPNVVKAAHRFLHRAGGGGGNPDPGRNQRGRDRKTFPGKTEIPEGVVFLVGEKVGPPRAPNEILWGGWGGVCAGKKICFFLVISFPLVLGFVEGEKAPKVSRGGGHPPTGK